MREDMGGFGCGSVSKMYAGPPNELTVLRVFYKTLKEIGYAASLLLLLHHKLMDVNRIVSKKTQRTELCLFLCFQKKGI
jgi:hypothetical protein